MSGFPTLAWVPAYAGMTSRTEQSIEWLRQRFVAAEEMSVPSGRRNGRGNSHLDLALRRRPSEGVSHVFKSVWEDLVISRRRSIGMFAAVASALALAAPAAAQTKWDLSTVWPDGNFHTKNAVRFADEVKTATNGAVEITVKAGGQLGFKGPEHLRAVRDGLVPIADILNIQQIGDEPMLGTEGVPFLSGSADELKVLHKYLRPEYEKIAAKNNQKILYMVPWPTQYLHLKVKVDTLDGLKAIKIRVPDKGASDMLTAVGMSPVLIPWGETIPALASGAVAGVSTSSVSGVDGKFWEFLKYFYKTNHVWSSQIMNVNLDAWKKLTPEQQKAIEDVAKKLEPEFWATSIAADAESSAKLKAQGMELVEIPEPMMKDFRAKTAGILDEHVKRVPAASGPIKAYLAEMKR
jgi:TRAP-type C4-dicarboxylate transport system substrate-binding protein